ncbi:MAG: hypothetical protein ACTSXO_01070 [Candidatus Heimdallarchaeota archaeon]
MEETKEDVSVTVKVDEPKKGKSYISASKLKEYSVALNLFGSTKHTTSKITGEIYYIIVDLPKTALVSFRVYPEGLPDWKILDVSGQSGFKLYPVKHINCDKYGENLNIGGTHYDHPVVMDRLVFEVDNAPREKIYFTIRYKAM